MQKVVTIDGKRLRRSYDKASHKSAIHMVSAWATKNHASLGQTVVDAKSNEITAIPKLLEILEISGALITIDAMGYQTEIAAKIIDNEADYCLAVKGNADSNFSSLGRAEVVDCDEVDVYHCWNRVVQRRHLLGVDLLTGQPSKPVSLPFLLVPVLLFVLVMVSNLRRRQTT